MLVKKKFPTNFANIVCCFCTRCLPGVNLRDAISRKRPSASCARVGPNHVSPESHGNVEPCARLPLTAVWWPPRPPRSGRSTCRSSRGRGDEVMSASPLDRVTQRLADRLRDLDDRLDDEPGLWPEYVGTVRALTAALDHVAPGRRGELLTTAQMAKR